MAEANKKTKKKNTKSKNKKEPKYNAENEIIIGVTTKPKEVRVDNKKSTRTKPANKKKKRTSSNTNKNHKKNNYKKKEKNNLTKNQEIKKLNRKKVIISLFILFIIVIAGIIYFLTTPMFNIANIEIIGNNKNSIETYISLSKIELNATNIFAVTKNGITKNVKENPYVESVSIKRKLPNTLLITIQEREVSYQAQYNDKYIYIDKQGYILEINDKRENTTIIEGLLTTKEAISEGQRLNKEDLIKLDTVLKIVNYCKYNSLENEITSINVLDTSNYILSFDKDKQIAYLGNDTKLNEKILRLKKVLEKEKGNSGEIFVNEDAVNRNRVYFRPAN